VPLGVNFTHYDNTQTAQHGRRVPDRNAVIPIALSKFTNSCECRIPPLPALSPLIKGGEGRGEGGFEADAFTNFGSEIGIRRTTLGNRWTVLALGVVVHQHTIPIAWKVVRGNTKGA
jgi:hypothetical protein